MIACIDGGLVCVGVPALLITLFPCIGLWLKKRCKCKRQATTSKQSVGTSK
jgi:ascorbate-specific PTS system EIIC-type component UlaA